jgi:hypothetical protein
VVSIVGSEGSRRPRNRQRGRQGEKEVLDTKIREIGSGQKNAETTSMTKE